MNVKLGICNFCVPGTGMFAAKHVAEAGLDGMSIEFGTYEKGFPLSLAKVQEDYKEEQQKYGIEYANIGMSGFDFISIHARKDDPMHEVVKGALKSAVNAAENLRIPMVFIPTFFASEIKNNEDKENAVAMFRYVSDLAGEKGITIAWENVMTAAEQIEIVEAVDRENFGLFFDSDNCYCMKGYDSVEMLKSIYGYMKPQLHVKDGTAGVMAGSLLGKGTSGFYEVIETLKQKDYSGWIIMENLYEHLPLRDSGDVFELFREDVSILKKSVGK